MKRRPNPTLTLTIVTLASLWLAACASDCDAACSAEDTACADASTPDASTSDAGPEASLDAVADAAPELATDAAPEAGVDMAPEADGDVSVDAGGGGRQCSDDELDELLDCFRACPEEDNACKSACTVLPSEACRDAYLALDACIATSGCGIASLACIESHCPDEWAAVFGSDEPADVPAPYGSASVAFTTDYVRFIDESFDGMQGVSLEPSVSGTFGAAGLPIQTAGANFQSYAYYYHDHALLGDGVQVMQIAFVDGVMVNPAVFMLLPLDAVAPGEVPFGLLSSDVGRLYLTDIDPETGLMGCLHGVGVGALTITAAGVVADHGALAFEGALHLYHPSNIYDQDLSGDLGAPVCDPQ